VRNAGCVFISSVKNAEKNGFVARALFVLAVRKDPQIKSK